jgi:hypothetical protein
MTITDDSTPTPEVASPDLTIEGISLPVIQRYFETMNAGEYTATAELFAQTGAMQPPFEQPIVGSEAIATFLEAEAKEMQLYPRQGITENLDDGNLQVQVSGKVQTPLFGVNVAWHFLLNAEEEILYTRIKLLASPQELLKLRR